MTTSRRGRQLHLQQRPDRRRQPLELVRQISFLSSRLINSTISTSTRTDKNNTQHEARQGNHTSTENKQFCDVFPQCSQKASSANKIRHHEFCPCAQIGRLSSSPPLQFASFGLSVCQSVSLSVCLSVCVCGSVSLRECCLFTPARHGRRWLKYYSLLITCAGAILPLFQKEVYTCAGRAFPSWPGLV